MCEPVYNGNITEQLCMPRSQERKKKSLLLFKIALWVRWAYPLTHSREPCHLIFAIKGNFWSLFQISLSFFSLKHPVFLKLTYTTTHPTQSKLVRVWTPWALDLSGQARWRTAACCNSDSACARNEARSAEVLWILKHMPREIAIESPFYKYC